MNKCLKTIDIFEFVDKLFAFCCFLMQDVKFWLKWMVLNEANGKFR